MRYNLLFDTKFTNVNNNWKYINCRFENGRLISSNKVFGIEQELLIPGSIKMYFACDFNILNSNIERVILGVQKGDTLEANRSYPVKNKNQKLSLVETSGEDKIKLHLIFESTEEENIVEVKKPIACNLTEESKVTWVKWLLDDLVTYRDGLLYKNQLGYSEIVPSIFPEVKLDEAKIGSIISTNTEEKLKINAKLIKGKRYLLKLDFEEINQLGNINLSYGVITSSKLENNQLALSFRASENIDLLLNIKGNYDLPYLVNLKHLVLIDTESLSIENKDIAYLPFI